MAVIWVEVASRRQRQGYQRMDSMVIGDPWIDVVEPSLPALFWCLLGKILARSTQT
jgi:hypothetical protein